MTTVQRPSQPTRPAKIERARPGVRALTYLKTTDPKVLGVMYIATSLVFFMIGGVLALIMRAELARPGMQFLSQEQYNQLFTMHGTIMLLLYATPIVFGFANFVLPLQIGAPDVAFPRLNAFSYWLFLFGAITVTASFATPNGAPGFGWTAYTPLSNDTHSPGAGADLWIMGLVIAGLGTILGAVQHDHHGGLLALPRHDDVADAHLHLERLRHLDPHPDRLPGADRRAARPGGGPQIRRPRLRPGQRRGHPVAAPVLVLRAPGGVRGGAAVLRHRHRGVPGVLAQAGVRLPRT